jgi:hypothetical protein
LEFRLQAARTGNRLKAELRTRTGARQEAPALLARNPPPPGRIEFAGHLTIRAAILPADLSSMKVTLNWLKQYVDCNWSPAELTERLTRLGLEVEGVRKISGAFGFGINTSASFTKTTCGF